MEQKSSEEGQLLKNLNPAQAQAVQAVSGPTLIIAGPGSGKTRVITHRAAYLMLVRNVNPRSILAVTFTNKAAKEMQERIVSLNTEGAAAPTACTFHTYCARMLREHGTQIGLAKNYSIFDQQDQKVLIGEAIAQEGYDPKRYSSQNMAAAIAKAKNGLKTPADTLRDTDSYTDEVVARVYRRYEELLQRNNATDFDGLIYNATRLLEGSSHILDAYLDRYEHIMVDEFQDTNKAQYRLTTLLASRYRNICVVGDPNQSIYSWRNAGPENINNFQQDYPDARTVRLDQNYRSTPNIIEAAKTLIGEASEPRDSGLHTQNQPGSPVTKTRANSPQHEAQLIVHEIGRLEKEEGISPGDCAVLYRVKSQSKPIEEACTKNSLPYRMISGTSFYQRKEIKDAVAYLRVLHNSRDEMNLARIFNTPPRGIAERSIKKITDLAQRMETSLIEAMAAIAEANEQGYLCPARLKPAPAAATAQFQGTLKRLTALARTAAPSQVVRALIADTGLKTSENEDNLEMLAEIAELFDGAPPQEGLSALLEQAALMSQADLVSPQKGALNLMTLHQAKGLEFKAVFMPGMEEGLLPHYMAMQDQREMEEERRLCFVGVTRAMSKLYLSWAAQRRTHDGSLRRTRPSRFLDEIHGPEEVPQRAKITNVPSRGDAVIHPKYGNGRVKARQSSPNGAVLLIAFSKAGEHRIEISEPPD